MRVAHANFYVTHGSLLLTLPAGAIILDVYTQPPDENYQAPQHHIAYAFDPAAPGSIHHFYVTSGFEDILQPDGHLYTGHLQYVGSFITTALRMYLFYLGEEPLVLQLPG